MKSGERHQLVLRVLAMAMLMLSSSVLAHFECDVTLVQQSSEASSRAYSKAFLDELPMLMESQYFSSGEEGLDRDYSFFSSMDGNTMAIGARDNYNDGRGSVEMFYFVDGQWQFIKKIESPNLQSNEGAYNASISGDTLVVGAFRYCEQGAVGCEHGIAYVYERNEGGPDNWGFVQQLDGGFVDFARFANSLVLDGGTIAIIATGEQIKAEHGSVLYLFEKGLSDSEPWSLAKRMEGPDSDGIYQGSFSNSMGLRGDTLVVIGHGSHTVLVYRRDFGGVGSWGLFQSITTPREIRNLSFDGNTIAVRGRDSCGPREEKKEYLLLYERDENGKWAFTQELAPEVELRQVAVEGHQLILAADEPLIGYRIQKDISTGQWEFVNRLGYTGENIDRYLSRSPIVDSGRVLIGFPYANDDAGSALAYQFAKPINAGHTGAWANFSTLGQGQLIELDETSNFMFLAWFTYTTEDASGPYQHQWFTAQGNYQGNKGELEVYETLGGAFDDPQAVTTKSVGTMRVTFESCGTGQAVYSLHDGALRGSFPIQRVIAGSDNVCEEHTVAAKASVDINSGMDGAWYDPQTAGQGFLMDVHPDPDNGNFLFVAWFTYGADTESGQRWLTAQGAFEGSTAELPIYETTGGAFDDPAATTTEAVGSMSLDFADCQNAVLVYSLDDGTEGSIDIQRVLPNSKALCEELAAAE